MKRLLVLFLFIFCFISCKQNLDDFLKDYFGTKNYIILKDKIKIDDHTFDVAVKYLDSDKVLFTSLIVYEKKENQIITHLQIKDGTIYNRKKEKIYESEYDVYGWGINIEYLNRFFLHYIVDKDDVVSTDMFITWNSKTQLFECTIHRP